MSVLEWEQLFQRAKTAVNNNQFWQAADLFTELLANTSPKTTDPAVQEMRRITLRERGRLLDLMGEPVAARLAYEQYYREAGPNRHAVIALVEIGNQHRRAGQYQSALEAYEQAESLAQSLVYETGRARALAGMGGAYVLLGRVQKGLARLEQATTLFEQAGNVLGQVQALNEKGVAYSGSGQFDKAFQAFHISLKLARQLNRQDSYVLTLNHLGGCYLMLFNIDQARQHCQEALQLAEVARLRVAGDIYRNLALAYYLHGRQEEALAHIHKALAVSQETDNLDLRLYALYDLATIEIDTGDVYQALQHAHELRELALRSDARGHLARALYLLGLVSQAQEDPNTAEELWHQATFLAHETDRRMLLWRLHAALAGVAQNQGLADVHYRLAGDIIREIAEPLPDAQVKQTFLTAVPIRAILQKTETAGG